jgi:hypothetical protein
MIPNTSNSSSKLERLLLEIFYFYRETIMTLHFGLFVTNGEEKEKGFITLLLLLIIE